jgi:hypothetical protein
MKIRKTSLLISIIFTSPFLLLCFFVLLSTVNPMLLLFITNFKVENQSGQDIWFTPIGTRGAEAQKGLMPIYLTAIPALPAVRIGNYYLKDGDTKKIKYDWDDVNFSEILIKAKNGQFYELIVDLEPTDNQYHPPKSKHFVIPELNTLCVARPNIIEVYDRKNRGWLRCLPLFGSAVFVLYCRMIAHYRKETVDRSVASANTEA